MKTEQTIGSDRKPAIPETSSDIRVTYDDRLNRILQAATAVIAEVGYEKASMRAVAKAAGISLAGLYHYFDSKEKMLFLIQFRTFSSLLGNLREKLLGVEEPLDQLRTMIRAHVMYFVANMAALKVCSHELDSLSGGAYDETRRIRHEYYNLTRSILERVLEKQAPSHDLDLHIATMSLFGTLNWLYRWYHPERNRSPIRLANQVCCQFLHGVLGLPSGPTVGRVPQTAEANPQQGKDMK